MPLIPFGAAGAASVCRWGAVGWVMPTVEVATTARSDFDYIVALEQAERVFSAHLSSDGLLPLWGPRGGDFGPYLAKRWRVGCWSHGLVSRALPPDSGHGVVDCVAGRSVAAACCSSTLGACWRHQV